MENTSNKSDSELLLKLNSKKTSTIFKGLCELKSSNIDHRFFEPLKNIAENSTTFKNKKLAFNLLTRYFPDKIHVINFRTDDNLGYVYFLQEKLLGHVKIGRSRNLEKRMRIFAADLPFETELITFIKTYNYEKIELEFHKHFQKKRVNGEWFKLDSKDISIITQKQYPEKIASLIKNA